MQRFLQSIFVSTAAALLCAHAAAQGADDCASATPISGTGSFAVSTVGATTGSQQTGSCVTINHDVWFLWTAGATQGMTFSTCGGTSADTVIAVYPGPNCPSAGTQLACNDDSCGVQSQLFFNAVAGSSYLLQIGTWSPNVTFTGTFSLYPGNSPCNLSVGPDVVVGFIGTLGGSSGLQNVTAANGLDAFTLSTTACNAGNALIDWIGATNQHPVIGETCYKYKVVNGSGRFEQIGISWLKHGFASDTTNDCCTCQIPLDNQHMGIGCADTYSAGQAGAQGSLTPRWQVNGFTGVFPFPGANPAWSGPTARRCEMLLSDLEVSSSSVQYFAECTYTTADDSQAGNGTNNASYIGLSVTGSPTNYTFALLGGTHMMQDAIRAWQTVESGVSISNVQVPNEGLFLLGSKATDLGGGLWHYEYAVHNVTSHRACGSFSVPLPVGATISNIGFHDITYRNGDGLNNVSQTSTDWPATQSGGLISWSCDPPGVDPNANAIRWATTYNFRFDANVAPVSGNVSVGLWDVGSPTAVSGAADVPSGSVFFSSFCDAIGTPANCPCGNNTSAGHGCENSAGTGGAQLGASGIPSLAADSVQFSCAGELPTALSIVLQGSASISPTNFGDGLRCAGGTLKRLFVQSAVGGTIAAPANGDASVSARSAFLGDTISSGSTRVYQVYYRDPSTTFCPDPPGGTFNASAALLVNWGS